MSTIPDPSLVEAVARRMLEQVGATAAVEKPSPLMAVLWESFWRTRGRHHRAHVDTAGNWKRLCEYPFPDGRRLPEMHAFELTSAWPEDYRDWRSKRFTNRGKPPAAFTINRHLGLARAILNAGVKARLIAYNPVGVVTMDPDGHVRQTVLRSEGEFEKLLKACDEVHPTLRPLCLLYFDSGLRKLEGMRLRWDEIEEKPGGGARLLLAARRKKNKKPHQPHITARTLSAINEMPRASEFVFANLRKYPGGRKSRFYGKPYSKRYIYKKFLEAVTLSGLVGVDGEQIVMHTLRHSFAYRARRTWKWSEVVIMAQGGWRTRKMLERYGITDDDELGEAMAGAEEKIAAEQYLLRESRKPPHRLETERDVGPCVPLSPEVKRQLK